MSRSKSLLPYYDINVPFEIGVDEAGRGPMFGPLYVSAVILPKPTTNTTFMYELMKDSKKFVKPKTPKPSKKIDEVADYIKANCVAWAVESISPEEIDAINIRQAVLKAMRTCIKRVHQQLSSPTSTDINRDDFLLLIDGNDFPGYSTFNESTGEMEYMRHETVEGGDNKYCSIAAASILAKSERDKYIECLCVKYPILGKRYGIDTNMGYGTKTHMDGIKEFGITDGHRKTYGICKDAKYNILI